MSARDSESGSSSYRGGSGSAGGVGNGGVGGGRGGGGNSQAGGSMRGGAGRNGSYAAGSTGLTTGKDWYGNSAYGRPGGNVQAYGTRDARSLGRAGMGPTVGTYSNFRAPNGAAMFGNSPAQGRGMGFHGMNMGQALSQARRADAAWQGAPAPEGLLGGTPTPAAAPSYPAYDAEMALPENLPAEDPMSIYATLTPVPGVPTPTPPAAPPAAPTSQYWGVRTARPSAITNAISAPDRNYRNNQTVSNYSYANDPSLGTGGPGGLGRYR